MTKFFKNPGRTGYFATRQKSNPINLFHLQDISPPWKRLQLFVLLGSSGAKFTRGQVVFVAQPVNVLPGTTPIVRNPIHVAIVFLQ